MRDTIDLLEAIGRDATLRRASPEELATLLEAADASTGLRELAATGDSAMLTKELGLVQMQVEHSTQTGGHEGDSDDDNRNDDDDDKDDELKQKPARSDDPPPT